MTNRKSQNWEDFYVYVLLDPTKPGKFCYGGWRFDYEPFYVGKGRGKRKYHHFSQHNLAHSSAKSRKIANLLAADVRPIICIKREGLTEVESFAVERKLIASIGREREGGPLTNITSGGQGLSGLEFSKSHRAAIGNAHRGMKRSAQTRKNISEANLQRQMPNDFGERVRQGHANRTAEEKAETSKRMSNAERPQQTEIHKAKRLANYRITIAARKAMKITLIGPTLKRTFLK